MVASQGTGRVRILTSFVVWDLTEFRRRRVDSQWIVAKKDWREAKKRSKKDTKVFVDQKGPEKSNSARNDSGDTESGTYQQDMDEMRCILYSHGGETSCVSHIGRLTQGFEGGYYFGSVDQERCEYMPKIKLTMFTHMSE